MKTIRVSRRLFSTYRSIQQAIMNAEPGSRIEVEPGIYREDLYINKYIEIVGVGEKEQTIIQGLEQPSVQMAAGYAVLKNITIKQPRKRYMDTVYIPNGALILNDCNIWARSGAGIMVLGDESEPIFRRCMIYSEKNAGIEIQNKGKTILEDCQIRTGNYSSIIIREGNPIVRRCTITGDEGYGVYVEDQGRGLFEECNIYGFHYSPAIGILRGNPHFVRCKIHDGQDSGVVIEEGRGRFQDCHFFSFERERPAVRCSKSAQPRFEKCVFRHCKGGAFLFEEGAGGMVEKTDCYGFTHAPAIIIRSDARPQFIHCKIHDGNQQGVVCHKEGKGLFESCEMYSFNDDVISITELSQLDLVRCTVAKGNRHGIFIAQRSKGFIQDTTVERFPYRAAIHVTQAADPKVINCKIRDSIYGVKVTENGHGTFEKCTFERLQQEVWEIKQGNPSIHLCIEEGNSQRIKMEPSNDAPLDLSPPLQELLYQLGQVIGQQQVKKELREFVLYLDYLLDRERMGIKTADQPDLNAVFIGPHQTGKDQVAVLYSKLLKELGYLRKAEVTSLSVKNDLLVSDRINQEAWSTNVRQAINGIIYLYEFPTLEHISFQNELLSFLNSLFNASKKLGRVVIIDVEADDWKEWIKKKPDLSTLRQYHFQDYLPEEMLKMFYLFAKGEDYQVHPTARDRLMKEMIHLWNLEDHRGQQERLLDYFQQVKVVHSLRCSKLPKDQRTKEVLTTIMPEDIQSSADLRPNHNDWLENIRKH